MSKGWVKLHRQIMNHPFYEEQRVFSRYEAWLHLVMMANHADNKTLIDGKMVNVERGSFITSVRKLQDRWKWSNTKTVKFLDVLESEKMIVKKSDTKKTLITLITYDIYQGEDEEKRHGNDSETTQKRTNKNVKNDKNDKELKKEPKIHYSTNVSLTEVEYQKLITEIGETLTQSCIDYLDSYKIEKSYKTKSDYLTIKRWVVDAVRKSNMIPFKGGNSNAKHGTGHAGRTNDELDAMSF